MNFGGQHSVQRGQQVAARWRALAVFSQGGLRDWCGWSAVSERETHLFHPTCYLAWR